MDKVIAEFMSIALMGAFLLVFVFGIETLKKKIPLGAKDFLKKYGYFILIGLVILGFLIAK